MLTRIIHGVVVMRSQNGCQAWAPTGMRRAAVSPDTVSIE
jgi:hypothetical protein